MDPLNYPLEIIYFAITTAVMTPLFMGLKF